MKQSIQKWTKLGKICGRAPLKNLKRYGLLKFFKGCLPQILIGSFMNTLSQMYLRLYLAAYSEPSQTSNMELWLKFERDQYNMEHNDLLYI